MKKYMINKPRISEWIGGMYVVLTVFSAALFIVIGFWSGITSEFFLDQIFFFGTMVFVISLLVVITGGLYKTTYVIQNGVLSSWSLFATIKLKLKDIKKVERTLIPFYFRVGASLYSGIFYIPNVGWTRTIMTNLSDGILITTNDKKHYMITPSNPEKFMKLLKK